MFLGSAYSPEGINPVLLMALPVKQGACVALANGKAAADNDAIITDSNVDIVVETTVTDSLTGEPAITHCRWALSSGEHISTTNKGPLVFAAKELTALALDNNVEYEYEGVVMRGTPELRFADKL